MLELDETGLLAVVDALAVLADDLEIDDGF